MPTLFSSAIDSPASAFRRGARDALGIPLLVLMATFTGYTGLAREAGFDLPQVLVMTGLIWALPAQVVLLSAIAAGASLPAAALAVGLSGVRLMPMVVAILPELKTARTRASTLILISCYTAVTSWVIGMERLRGIPREWRTAWFLGVQATLVIANLAVAVAVFVLATGLVAAVIGNLVVYPSGALADTPALLRIGAVAAGFAAWRFLGRRMLVAIAVTEAILLVGVWIQP